MVLKQVERGNEPSARRDAMHHGALASERQEGLLLNKEWRREGGKEGGEGASD